MPETSVCKSNQSILKNGIWGWLAGAICWTDTGTAANKISFAQCSRDRTDLGRGFDPIDLKAHF